MSSPPVQTGPEYEVSINQAAVISIMKQLQFAKDRAAEGEYMAALASADYAWALLPNSVRSKVGDRPSKRYYDLADKYTYPVDVWRKANPDAYRLSDDQVKKDIRKNAFDNAELSIWTIVTDVTVQYITELDAQGLYIERGGTRIPTGNLNVSKQPPTSKVPPSLPRESNT